MFKKLQLVALASAVCSLGGWAQDALSQLNIQNGVVQLATSADVVNFAKAVSEGQNTLNAILLNDVEMDADFYGIGSQENYYEGNFDGNFHTVTMNTVSEDATAAPFGFVRCLSKGTLKNLHIAGSMRLACKDIGGVAGWLYNGATVQHCWCSAYIYSSYVGDAGSGGIVSNSKSIDEATGMGGFLFNNLFDGKMEIPAGYSCGGILGWAGKPMVLDDNIYVGEVIVLPQGSSETIGRKPANISSHSTNYYLTSFGSTSGYATQVTAEALADGSLCYSLNGDQTVRNWYQNLGSDTHPVPFSTHSCVYTTAPLRCDGKIMGDGVFTNDASAVNRPDHQYEDGFCQSCGGMQENYMTPEADGSYNIASSSQYKWMQAFINASENKAINLNLTADVTVEGNAGMFDSYSGIFDGLGHKLTYNIEADRDGAGIFGTLNGTLKNIVLEGSVTNVQRYAGAVAGYLSGRVENVISSVNVGTTYSGDATSGTIGGIAYAGAYLKNVLSSGSFQTATAHSNTGLIGWADGAITMENVAWTGECITGEENSSTLIRNAGNCTFKNCYYLNRVSNHYEGDRVSQITVDETANGSLCYKLNGGSITAPVFFQTIGTDEEPVLDGTHGVVYACGEEFADVHDDASFQTFTTAFTESEKAWAQDLYAQNALIEDYCQKVEALKTCSSMENYREEYAAVEADKDALRANVEAYAKFQQTMGKYLGYLNADPEKSSVLRDELRDYLETEQMPDATYTNGTGLYIYNKCTLGTDELEAETAYIETMWKRIGNDEIATGADVTALLNNADFSDGVNGWQGDPLATPWTFTPNVVNSWNCNSHMYQTLNYLKNGVYEVTVNGMVRPCDRDDSRRYFAYLYANDQCVPLQNLQEDLLPKAQAVNHENCLIDNVDNYPSDRSFNDGYYANSAEGLSYAIKGGRYMNRILVNVTDGTLTLGVNAIGTGLGYDWTVYGNVKLYYCGELAEAGESLTGVLAGQVARANTLLSTEASYGEDYKIFPNFSAELKGKLAKAIEDASAADTPEKQYEVVTTFSTLFPAVYDCQQAYIRLMGQYEMFYSAVNGAQKYLEENRWNELNNQLSEAINEGYIEGKFSTEEAANWKLDLFRAGVSEDGYYLISDKAEYAMFAYMAPAGQNVNGRLAADIEGIENDLIIESLSGVLDGAFHSITVNLTATRNNIAPIHYLYGTVRNLVVKGTINAATTEWAGGIVGEAHGCKIENCESQVTIQATADSNFNGRHGGIAGWAGGLTIDNCLSNVQIIANEHISNCAGFIGDAGESCYLNNSLYTGKMQVSTDGTHIFARGDGKLYCNNSYYDELFGQKDEGAKKASEEQLKGGELCYLLNNGETESPAWYQTLGEDATPVLDPTHKVVYKDGDKYVNDGENKNVALITSASQLSSNASDIQEGQHIEYLIDGDATTFWHTDWHGVCTDQYHYLEVALNEQFTGDITMEITRRQHDYDHPIQMLVWGSQDGVEFTEITTLNLSYEGAGTKTLALFHAEGVNYLRFASTKNNTGNNTFWHAAEFQLYGDNTNAISDISAETISKDIYNLSGARVSRMEKGRIYIQGNKKVLYR